MNISFFGSGNMSRVLAGAFRAIGHTVFIGSRDPVRASDAARELGLDPASASGTNDQAADFGEIVVHTVRDVPSRFLRNPAALADKIVIDVNNRTFPRDFVAHDPRDSLAAAVQRDLPSARVVKAFNNAAQEVFHATPAAIRAAGLQSYLAGNDDTARRQVAELLAQLGFQPVDFGPLSHAWLLEVQADLLRAHMFATGNFLATPALVTAPTATPRFGERRKGVY